MKAKLLIFLLAPLLSFSQVQIGQDLDGEALGDLSGFKLSLSADGNIVAVSGWKNDGNGTDSGHVRVYENISGIWTQVGQDIDGEAAGDQSGVAVSLSSDGSIVAIGAWLNDGNGSDSGHVRVYENISGVWTQIGTDIDGETSGDRFGRDISLSSDGSILAAGAIYNGGNGDNSGHVRVYENILGVWTQIGTDIDGEAVNDTSGISISLSSDGSIVAIGASGNDANGDLSGHVRVFENISGVWTQIGSDIDGEASGDGSGGSISLSSDGTIIAIGASYNDGNGTDSGHVRVYKNLSGVWTQVGQDIDGESVGDSSGFSVSLSSDGSIVAIGAWFNDGNGSNSGHVRVYKNLSGVWTQIGSDIDGEAAGDYAAEVSISSDGSIAAIGAYGNDGNGSSSGSVRVYDLSSILSNNEFLISNIGVYPNPTSNKVILKLGNNMQLKKANLYNSIGQFVNTFEDNTLNISNLAKGFYFLEIETNKGKTTKKIVKE